MVDSVQPTPFEIKKVNQSKMKVKEHTSFVCSAKMVDRGSRTE